MRSVTLIAKGPSAVCAPSFVEPGDDIAAVNDAGRFIEREITYAFFTDAMRPMVEHQQRISRFVSPAREINRPVWYRPQDHITYAEGECEGTQDAFEERIQSGGICHHHTTTGAMHWLAKVAGYNRIRIIGVDGGHQYAPGSFIDQPLQNKLREDLGNEFLDDWKLITIRLAELLTKVYGTEFVWYA